jgi:hypothetical protein
VGRRLEPSPARTPPSLPSQSDETQRHEPRGARLRHVANDALPGVGAPAAKSAALSFVSTFANSRAIAEPAAGSGAALPSPTNTSVAANTP